MGDMVKITGLWKQQDKNGQTYLAGTLSQVSKVMVMPNSYKKTESDPDYFFYLGAKEYEKKAVTVKPFSSDI
jgi:uncharacterized protein (DUF736 family)